MSENFIVKDELVGYWHTGAGKDDFGNIVDSIAIDKNYLASMSLFPSNIFENEGFNFNEESYTVVLLYDYEPRTIIDKSNLTFDFYLNLNSSNLSGGIKHIISSDNGRMLYIENGFINIRLTSSDNSVNDYQLLNINNESVTNEFRHYALKTDGTKVYLFLDGVLKSEKSIINDGVLLRNTDRIIFGGTDGSSFRGIINSIKVYNKSLSNTEIEQNSNIGVGNIGLGDFIYENRGEAIYLKKYIGKDTDVVIPNKIDGFNVTLIGQSAFKNRGLTSVILPNHLETISEESFRDNLLTSINIPNSVSNIGYSAFQSNRLTSLDLSNVSADTIGYNAFADNEITSASLPQELKEINTGLFQNNKIESINLPSNIKNIGSNSFYNNRLTSINLPSNLEFIGGGAFSGNLIEGSLEIPLNVLTIGDSAFYNNNINNLIINNVDYIGSSSFQFNSISNLIIPSSVKTLRTACFSDNNIENLTILSNKINEIPNNAFSNNNISMVNVPSSIKVIGDSAFQNNNIDRLTLPSNLEIIGRRAFQNNRLTNVVFTNFLSSIGDYSFADNNIDRVIIHNPGLIFGEFAFENNQISQSNLILVSYRNSTVESYAQIYGYTFEDIESQSSSTKPIVNVISATRIKLSNQPNMNDSTIVFKFGFSQDIQEWRAVLLGSSYDTGTIIDSGGFVEKGSEVTTQVNYSQLYGEGDNRINFYGKNLKGEWTPYNDNRSINDDTPIDDLMSAYGSTKYGTIAYGNKKG